MKIIIENGHGSNTLGKCSPDRRLMEWRYTREIAKEVVSRLKAKGYDVVLLVPEDHDVSLAERVRRANSYGRNSVFVSIHCNAAGSDGQWHNATGWTGWVAPNCSDKSKALAQILYTQAEQRGLKGNRCVPPCKYWSANYYVLRNTIMPAVLTENLFQDNQSDVNFLLSEKGREAIISLHVDGIINYLKNVK